jgi:hypothetical protein
LSQPSKEQASTNTATDAAEKSKVLEKAKESTEMGFEQRIEAVIKDVLDVKFKALDLRIDKMIDDKLREKEIEVEKGLRKSFGVETDPVIHQSDLVAALRKAALATGGEEKRSPAGVEKAGPDGNTPENPFAKKLKEFGAVV